MNTEAHPEPSIALCSLPPNQGFLGSLYVICFPLLTVNRKAALVYNWQGSRRRARGEPLPPERLEAFGARQGWES